MIQFVSVLYAGIDGSVCSVDRFGVCWVIMLRRWCHNLQDVAPTRLLLAVFCGLLLVGLALTTLTQPNAAHTIHLAAEHSTANQSRTSPLASHQANCHDLKPSSDQHAANPHNTDLADACCAWWCAAHAVLPNMLTAVLQPAERVLADPFNFVRIQNPQLAHVRRIERPPRVLA
jgi:hypothetical protein